ncbi:hypothetical protein ISU10_01475 [Nocardioides agariphilus]|jgi:hypothetical protein|uniref:Uncharacterized protein n=1 Tax=Nocardioides agariphilus TaxID=433664 RepID=A0A930VKD2_9ACTN|nr:hypothetical protein [Nocardioides agariphilus]MBF4766433.1 hypothetical protein [Nocardioides agariphilus]
MKQRDEQQLRAWPVSSPGRRVVRDHLLDHLLGEHRAVRPTDEVVEDPPADQADD